MICADVQSLARAAPEPTAAPKISMGNADNSFDQFLEAVKTSDRPTRSDFSTRSKSSVNKTDHGSPAEQEKPVDHKPVSEKPTNEKKINEKPVEAKKTDQAPTDPEPQPEVVEESIQEVIASAVAAQIAAAAAPIQQAEAGNIKDGTMETSLPAAAVPVMQEQQSPVIQLPETEPQPLPDELKQAMQQPKVEAANFQKLVDTASQNLENQVVNPEVEVQKTVNTNAPQVVDAPEVKILDTQEPAVKVVDLNVQPEDMVELEPANKATGIYAMTSTRSENLVQKEALPIIQKVSTEVAQLARENGQSMRIQIHPENLGKIDLKLVSNSSGMKVIMTAEVPATAKLLETHLDQLQQQLADAGVSISGMSVNSQGAQGQFANPSQSQSQSNVIQVTIPEFNQDSETPATQTLKVSSSSLDYRI